MAVVDRRRQFSAFDFVSVALLACAAVAGCGRTPPPAQPVQTVRGGVAEEIHPDTPARYSVTIQPYRQVDLAFKSPGIVESLYQIRSADGHLRDVQTGDRVAEGVELGRVRATDYEQRVDQARAGVNQARAQVAEAQALADQARLNDARATNLYKSASLTKPEFDQAEARRASADAQLAAANAALAAAHTTLDEATTSLADAAIHAPFTGWIAARNVEPGALVGSATTAFTLIDTHLVKAAFDVPDTALQNLARGQRVSIALDALADPVSGVVTTIAPAADPKTHVYAVEVTLENPKEIIRPGMVGALTLGPARPSGPRLVVPLAAVVRDPGQPGGVATFRIETRDGKTFARVQPVTTGETFGNAIEITSGLRAGDRLVTLGGELLHDGDEIHVLQ